jgi:hypothetical protein
MLLLRYINKKELFDLTTSTETNCEYFIGIYMRTKLLLIYMIYVAENMKWVLNRHLDQTCDQHRSSFNFYTMN